MFFTNQQITSFHLQMTFHLCSNNYDNFCDDYLYGQLNFLAFKDKFESGYANNFSSLFLCITPKLVYSEFNIMRILDVFV